MPFENIRASSQHEPREFQALDELKALGLPKPPKGEHPLDKEDVRKRFNRVYDWWMQERVNQMERRTEAMRDHEIYDGPGQWTDEERAILRERLQEALIFNQVQPTIKWVSGTEKKIRIDWRVMPRGEEDAPGAENKTKLMKYISDVNNVGFRRSMAFADAVISGVGWLDHCVVDDSVDEKIQIRYEDWRNVWYDSLAVEPDLSDARYIFRGKWVDEDYAVTWFPDRADVIHAVANQGVDNLLSSMDDPAFDESLSGDGGANNTNMIGSGFFSVAGEVSTTRRNRVFLVEAWYRVPARTQVLRGGRDLGTLNGVKFDEAKHGDLVQMGMGVPTDTVRLEMRQMIFCGSHVLSDEAAPYRHNRFPLVPIWGFRRKKDNAPYGMVRNLRDPQRDLNKRRSKALYILNSNKTIVEEDSWVGTLNEFYDSRQRPDGITVMKKDKIKSISTENDRDIAREHIALMEQDERYLQNASGVTDELMGRSTNAVSGIAISNRQEQGHVITADLFDNYRLAFKLSGEITLSLIEQYKTDEEQIRIIGKGNKPEFLNINTPNPETGRIENDITETQADFIVSEQDYSATVRKAMFDTLSDMMTKLAPEVSVQLLDLVFDLSDLPEKEKFVERIRQINGQTEPDAEADPNAPPAPDPEADARVQESELQNQILQTRLAAEQAKVAKLEQDAQLVAAKIKTELVNQQVSAAGVDYDREKLRIERAQTLNAIESAEHGRKMMEKAQSKGDGVSGDSEAVKRSKGLRGHTERGIKSNNKDKG
jgi:hypothetical protein